MSLPQDPWVSPARRDVARRGSHYINLRTNVDNGAGLQVARRSSCGGS
jgi:hypothetical protein